LQGYLKLVLLFCLLHLSLFARSNDVSISIALIGIEMDYREYDSTGKILDSEFSQKSDFYGVDAIFGY